MTDENCPPFNPYEGMDPAEIIHDSSVFPHGRYDPYFDPNSPTPEMIWERQASCPYCAKWAKAYARRQLESIENDKPETGDDPIVG